MRAQCRLCKRPVVGHGLCDTHRKRHVYRLRAYGRFDNGRHSVDEARERLAQLQAAGIGTRQIRSLTGLSRSTIMRLAAAERRWIDRRTHELIMGLAVPASAVDLASASALVDSTGSVRRLRALARIGYGGPQITASLGLSDPTALSGLYSGRAKNVTAQRAQAIADLFNKLQMTEGSSRVARQRATQKGWPLPLQWDEDTIDDPAVQPIYGSNFSTATERLEELQDMGVTDTYQLAQRLDVKPESVERQLQRIKAATRKEGAA